MVRFVYILNTKYSTLVRGGQIPAKPDPSVKTDRPNRPSVRPFASHIRTDMDKDFIIFWISRRITDFSYLVGYPPDSPDQLTINIYKRKKKSLSSHISYFSPNSHFFHWLSLISQSSKSWSSTTMWISSKAVEISSPSLLLTSISLSLSHFLFCFIVGEGRSRRAPPLDLPPPQRGSRSSETSPDLVRTRRIWWDLVGSWPDLASSAASPPSTSLILSNIGVFADFFLLCFVDFFFLCVVVMVSVLLWWFVDVCCWVDFLFVCCCNGKNPRNPTVTTCQNRSTDPSYPTT